MTLWVNFLQGRILAGPLEHLDGFPLGFTDGVEIKLGGEPILRAQDQSFSCIIAITTFPRRITPRRHQNGGRLDKIYGPQHLNPSF